MVSEQENARTTQSPFDLADFYFNILAPAVPIVGMPFVMGTIIHILQHPNDESSAMKKAEKSALFGFAIQMFWFAVLMGLVLL